MYNINGVYIPYDANGNLFQHFDINGVPISNIIMAVDSQFFAIIIVALVFVLCVVFAGLLGWWIYKAVTKKRPSH